MDCSKVKNGHNRPEVGRRDQTRSATAATVLVGGQVSVCDRGTVTQLRGNRNATIEYPAIVSEGENSPYPPYIAILDGAHSDHIPNDVAGDVLSVSCCSRTGGPPRWWASAPARASGAHLRGAHPQACPWGLVHWAAVSWRARISVPPHPRPLYLELGRGGD